MEKLQRLIDRIDSEVENARAYAEQYIDQKSKGEQETAARFKQMGLEALEHVETLREILAGEIGRITKVYTPPEGLANIWTMAGREHAEKSAWIRQMLCQSA